MNTITSVVYPSVGPLGMLLPGMYYKSSSMLMSIHGGCNVVSTRELCTATELKRTEAHTHYYSSIVGLYTTSDNGHTK